ncbi:aldehyde dehydrogenase family protein, partial [Mesorhizobium sp. M1D.F.Ca.ET.183.01.1.1]|uniref:aldehyde dehydrogenase family protein n=1 Tax=Mesorhizobium sp. M1D.F.Ca.ET.183.01.1.1 TaxID=2496666 RepID=UPI001093F599
DPSSGAIVAIGAAFDAKQTTKAIDAAARALRAWRSALPQERSATLRKWFELIVAAKDDLALLMTLEQGKPLKESLGEIDYAASFVEWYAEEAKRLNAESVTSHLRN